MEDRIRIFLNNYINGLYFPTVHLTDVIEILIITVIVYEIMDALKRDDHAGGILFACRDL